MPVASHLGDPANIYRPTVYNKFNTLTLRMVAMF